MMLVVLFPKKSVTTVVVVVALLLQFMGGYSTVDCDNRLTEECPIRHVTLIVPVTTFNYLGLSAGRALMHFY